MCGIAGIVAPDGFKIGEIVGMNNLARHRGPDDEGYVVFEHPDAEPVCYGGADTPEAVYALASPYRPVANAGKSPEQGKGAGGVVGLAQRRLAILDLSPQGHLPMCDLQERFWICYNGEIYNFLELREELKQSGHRFFTRTDTEVVLAAFDKWGPHCQDRFLGMWAFAIYDRRENTLFLSRDRFGMKPLYYWFSPDGAFCFASEIKQFSALKGWKAMLNGPRVADFLFHALTDHTDETMFDGVFHLPAGHCAFLRVGSSRAGTGGRIPNGTGGNTTGTARDITAGTGRDITAGTKQNIAAGSARSITPGRDGRIPMEKWYNPKPHIGLLDFHEAAGQFRDIFREAVGMHLRSDVPVGSALSGGLDSSAIVCVISEILKSEGRQSLQKTFTCDCTDPKFSERPWVDEVVNMLDLEARFVFPSHERLDELTPLVLWHQDEPYQTQQSFLSFHVFELAGQNGVKVMLNGQGADEYLSAYGDFRTLRWKQLAGNLRYRRLKDELSHYGKNGLADSLYYFINPVTTLLPDKIKYMVARQKKNVRKHLQLIDTKKLNGDFRHPNQVNPHGTDSMEQIARYRLFHNPLPKYLRYADRNSMAHSVEARLPFLDHRLPELCMSLPLDFLDGKGESKRLLVHAMKGILPEKVRLRKDKKGFITPEERWIKKDHTAYFREKMREAVDVTGGIIQPGIIPWFDDLSGGRIPFSFAYIQPILFAEWMKVFNVQK